MITKHYHGDDERREGADGRHPPGVRGHDGRGVRDGRGRVPARRAAPDARPHVPRLRLPADGRAAALPGGERLHELHRLGRRPRLHAPGHRGRSTASRPSGSSAARTRCATRTTSTAARSSTWREPDVFDDGPVKPVRIWSRIGRRPILAGGNSNGDIEMLPVRRRDGPARRCGCWCCTTTPSASSPTRPAPEKSLKRREAEGWTVVSVKNDWADRFADPPAPERRDGGWSDEGRWWSRRAGRSGWAPTTSTRGASRPRGLGRWVLDRPPSGHGGRVLAGS